MMAMLPVCKYFLDIMVPSGYCQEKRLAIKDILCRSDGIKIQIRKTLIRNGSDGGPFGGVGMIAPD
jgi:hypothetical protein